MDEHGYKDTVCACGHWFEEHEATNSANPCACPGCTCTDFELEPSLNTPESIADRGGQHEQPCSCALCLKTAEVRIMKTSDIKKCPFVIFMPSHYREDGSCKCDDPDERKMMIKEWGYTKSSFKGIKLRK